MREARVVVYFDPAGRVGPDALLAAGSGAVLMARRHPADERPGGLATLLADGAEIYRFRGALDLVGQISALSGDSARREAVARAGWQRACRDHGPESRLKTLEIAASSINTSGGH